MKLSDTIQALKVYAKEQKITYKDISVRSGIPEGTLRNIFSGVTKNPRIDTIVAIKKSLGIEKDPPNDRSDSFDELLARHNITKKRLENLDEKQRTALLNVIKAFLDGIQ